MPPVAFTLEDRQTSAHQKSKTVLAKSQSMIKFNHSMPNQVVMPVQPWALSFARFGNPSPTDRAPLRAPATNPTRTRRRSTTASSRLCISNLRRPASSTGFRSTSSCRFSKFSARGSRRGSERSANHGNFWSRIIACGFIFCSISLSLGTLFSSPRLTCDRVILFSKISPKILYLQKTIAVLELSIVGKILCVCDFCQLLVDSVYHCCVADSDELMLFTRNMWMC